MKAMKKLFSSLLFIFGFISVIFSTISCEIGLGAAVDTEPPKLEIQNPPVDVVIRDKFAISGDWSDDGSIAFVSVKLEPTDREGPAFDYKATFLESKIGTGTWKAIIDPSTDNITDGAYQATVTISDNTGRETTKTRSFTIDNTPPVIVLTRPSTSVDSGTSDTYGQKFTIEGQAADTNNISRIEIQLFNDKDCTQPAGEEPIVLKNVPLSISLDAANYDSASENYLYKGENETEFSINVVKDGVAKQFYCKLFAYDGAARYVDEDEAPSADDSKGNKAESYYLYKDIYTPILQYYKITDLYSILSGTYYDTTARAVSPGTVKQDLLSESKYQKRIGSFKLNPKNNPTFTVTGHSPLALNGTDFTDTANANDITNGQNVFVEVSPGLDDIPLEASSLRVYAIECDSNGIKLANAEKIYPEQEKEERGSSYRISVKLQRSEDDNSGLKIGKTYLFGVDGYDQSDAKNAIEPDGGKDFGFKLVPNGNAPTLTIDSPKDTTTYIKKNGTQVFTGSVEVEMGAPKIYVYKGTDEDANRIHTITLDEKNATKTNNGLKYNFTYNPDSFGTTNGIHKYIFKADLTGTLSQPVEKTIVYDMAAPNISVLSITPNIEDTIKDSGDETGGTIDGNYINKTTYFTIAIVDEYDSVAEATYQITVDGVSEEPVTISTPTRYNFEIDTTKYVAETEKTQKTLTLIIKAKDRAGNETVTTDNTYTYTIDQSTDIPLILPGSPDSITFKLKDKAAYEAQTGDKKGIATVGSSLLIKLHDDDGLKQLIIKNSEKNLNSWNENNGKWVDLSRPKDDQIITDNTLNLAHRVSGTDATFSYPLPSEGGFFKFYIEVEDVFGKKATKEFVLNITKAAAEISSVTQDEYKNAANGTGNATLTNKISIVESQPPYKLYKTIGKGTETLVSENIDSSGFPYYDEISAKDLAIGENTISYRIEDANERKSGSVETTLIRDDEVPEVTLKALPSAVELKSFDTFTFQGTVKDTGLSGVDKVVMEISGTGKTDSTGKKTYTITPNNGNWVNLVDWKELFEDSEGKKLEGEKTVTVQAYDKAENKSAIFTDSFIFDTADPLVSLNSPSDKEYKKADLVENTEKGSFDIAGKVTETNDLESVTIEAKSKTVTKTLTLDRDSLTRGTEENHKNEWNWSQNFVYGPGYGANPSESNYLPDGVYSISVIAKDKAGNSSSKESVKVTIDTKAPDIKGVKVDGQDEDTLASKWLNSKTLPVTVSVTDNLSETITVEYYSLEGKWESLGSNYSGNVTFVNGENNTLKIRAKDGVGNIATYNDILLKIDDSPADLETLYYQIDGNELKEIATTVYVKKNITDPQNPETSSVTVYGKYSDSDSGLSAAPVIKLAGTTISPSSISYSADTGTLESDLDFKTANYNINSITTDNCKNIRYWKATFVPTTNGQISIIGKNVAAKSTEEKPFSVKLDTSAPVLSNITLSDSYVKDSTTYFIYNTNKTFTLGGVASDNFGVESISLSIVSKKDSAKKIEPAAITDNSDSNWNFTGLDMKDWDPAGAKATLTIKDVAGWSVDKELTINFDTTAPSGKSEVDAKDKDLYFRVGKNGNDDENKGVESEPGKWNPELDTDVGGKYELNTYGNDNSIFIRGYADDGNGCGVSKIYYKVYNSWDENDINLSTEDVNNIKKKVVGEGKYFELGKEDTKRVFYNVNKAKYDAAETESKKNEIALGGTLFKTENEYYKFYKNVTTNFSASISGFNKEGDNYLVLVIEDNLGNQKVWEKTLNGTRYSNFKINVDKTDPVIESTVDAIINTRSSQAVSISGTLFDAAAGIKKDTFAIMVGTSDLPSSNITITDPDTEGNPYTWSATIPADLIKAQKDAGSTSFSVIANVRDNAGTGNLGTEKITKISIDDTAPTLSFTSTAGFVKGKVGGKIEVSVYADDLNGIKDNKVYYNIYEENTTTPIITKTNNKDPFVTISDGKGSFEIDISNTTNFKDKTNYVIKIHAEDSVGNSADVDSENYTIDNTAPQTTSLTVRNVAAVDLTNTWFKDTALLVEGSFTDINGSGVKKVYYKLAENGTEEEVTPVKDSTVTGKYNYSVNISFEEGDSNKLYFSAEDTVGNKLSYSTPYTIKIDGTAPDVVEKPKVTVNGEDVSPYPFDKTYLTNKDQAKPFKFDITEALSGIKEYTVKLGPEVLELESATSLTTADITKNFIVIGKQNTTTKKYPVELQIGTITIGQLSGNKAVQVRITDNANNKSDFIVIGYLNIDNKAPELTFTEPTKSTVNKTITVSGKVDEANKVESITLKANIDDEVKKTYNYSADSTTNAIRYDAETKVWSVTVDTKELYSGTDTKSCTFSVIATDEANNTTATPVTKTVTIDQNTDRPVIKFTNMTLPAAGSVVKYHRNNLVFEITDDDKTITDADVSYIITETSETTRPDASATTWITNNKLTYDSEKREFTLSDLNQAEHIYWFKINDGKEDFISSYSSSADLTAPIIQNDAEVEYRTNTALKIMVDTVDPIVDTGFPKYHRITESTTYQTTDWKTLVTRENGVVRGINEEYFGGKYKNKVKISLYVWDDNKISSVKLSMPDENGENPTESPFTKATENLDGYAKEKSKATDNPWVLYYLDIDTKNKETSSRSCKIIITDGGDKTTEVPFTLNIDNTAPYLTGSITPVSTDPVFGTVKVRGEIRDDGVGFTGVTTGENNTQIPSGQLTYYIPTYTQFVENKPENIVDTEDTKYWKDPTTPGNSSWTIELNELNKTIGYDSSTETVAEAYKDYGKDLNGLYRIPVWFKLIDDAGTETYDKSTVKILYNPNADKPTVRITEPTRDKTDGEGENSLTYALSGGKFKIRGTAKDDIGISAVYLQFDMDGDTSNGFENGSTLAEGKKPNLNIVQIPHTSPAQYGVRVSGEENWNYEIDAFNLENLNTKEKHLRVRAIAIDEGHKNAEGTLDPAQDIAGSWSETWHIYVSNVKPQISVSELRKYSSAFSTATATSDAEIETLANNYISEKEYRNNMSLKTATSAGVSENWYLYGEVRTKATDAHIIEINTDSNIQGSWKYNEGSTDIFSWRVTENGQEIQKVLIPVNKAGNGEWTTRITAKNDFEGDSDKTTNWMDISLRIDNSASKFVYKNGTGEADVSGKDLKLHKGSYGGNILTSASSGDNTIQNSNGTVSLWGKIRESESEFEKLAFYIKRGTNVYITGTNDFVQEITTYSTNTEGFPVTVVTGVTRNNDNLYKFTLPTGTAVPAGVHEGGLVKIGGQYRTIRTISGSTITMDSECKTKFTEVEFVYAMVVDSSNESITTGSSVSITETDNDGMYERYITEGNDTTWTVSLNSKNIVDGPISINCVVFDKAGNISSGSTDAFISNNPPRITSVMLGTDLNADGKYTITESDGTSEFKRFWASGKENDRSVAESVFNIDAKIDSTTYWTVKKDLVLIPEFVGGNDDIYYRYTKTTGTSGAKLTAAETGSIVATGEGDNVVPATLKKLIYKASTDAVDTAVLAKIIFPEGKTLDSYKVSSDDMSTQNGVIVLKNNTAANATENELGKITKTGDYEKAANGTVSNAGVNVYSFSFWDSTTGCTEGQNSQWCVLNITMKQDIHDGTAPSGYIQPFYWSGSGSDKSSVFYNASEVQGHIELSDDLPALFNSNSGEFDKDPKVSGQIIIKGNAKDENRIDSFTVAFANVSAIAEFSNENQNWQITYKRGSTTSNSNDTGLTLSLDKPDDAIPTQIGHSVDWTMIVDTTKVISDAVAGTDKLITVIVTDASSNVSPEYNNGTSVHNTTESDKEPYYRVDIVPYITGISTPNRSKSGLKNNNIRSASGKYSIMYASSNTAKTYDQRFIVVDGFNLEPDDYGVRIVSSDDVNTKENSYSSSEEEFDYGIDLTFSSADENAKTTEQYGYKKFWIDNIISNSGFLEVFVNGVRSLNNINDNEAHDLKGAGDKIGTAISYYENYYNREPDYITTKNVRLTDDRYLTMWDMKDTGTTTKNGYYPMMLMNGDNPVFSYLNLSGSTAARAGTNYPAYAMPQRAEFSAENSEVYTEYLVKESAGDQMCMAKDDDGRYHHISVFDRAACDMYYIYDKYSELEGNNGWGPGVTIGSGWYKRLSSTKNNGLCLESVDLGGVMVGRYQYPKMVAKGNSKTDVSYVYALYYDDYYKQIIFRNFQVGVQSKVSGNTKYQMQSNNYKDNNNTPYNQYTNLQENVGWGEDGNNTYNTGRQQAVSSGASKHFDMKVTRDNHVVIVYYDEIASCLKLQYSRNAVTGSSPTTAVAWVTSSVSFPEYVGTYVSLDLDKDNGIHIAAFDANDSDLYYMYLPGYGSGQSDLIKQKVDQYGSVGHWTQVRVDKTHTSSKYYNKPVIAYYNSTETGGRDSIKLAIANATSGNTTPGVDSNNYTTGAWEYMTVPALNPPQGGNPKFQNVCLDFDSAGRPVVGYLGDNLEFGKALDE